MDAATMALEAESEYERARQATIARNQAVLASLGLATPTGRTRPQHALGKRARPPSEPPADAPAPPVRRSLRVALMGAAPSYTEPRVDVGRWRRDRAELDADEAPSAESATVGAKRAANRAWAASVAASSPAAAPQPAAGERSAADVANARAGASASTRDLHADVPRLQREWLGRFIPPLGGQVKAAVMQLAVRGVMPKFNKYSGIIEWANAFFLCVNIGGDNYRNVFLDDGRRMTWFAQPSQTEASPAIQGLLSGDRAVLLFCRPLGQPYLYCGQLTLVVHDATARPMRFVWELRDVDALRAGPGSDAFDAVVRDAA